MDLWDWFDRCRRRCLDNQDADRLRLVDAYSRAYACRETEPARTVALFTEARDLAVELREPEWRLVHEKFRLDALMHFQRDFRAVLEPARQLTLDIDTLASAEFPDPALFHDTLLAAYLGIDAEEYAEPIGKLLAALETAVPEQPAAARYLVLARRRQFALEQERFADAAAAVEVELDLAGHDADAERAMHFSMFAHAARCLLAQRRDAGDELAQAAGRTLELAERSGHLCEQAEALAWLALAARRAGREPDAQGCLERAEALRRRLAMPPTPGLFTALAAFHEQGGNLAAAWTVRDEELAHVGRHNRRLAERRLQIERMRLLAWLGRPLGNLAPKDRASQNPPPGNPPQFPS